MLKSYTARIAALLLIFSHTPTATQTTQAHLDAELASQFWIHAHTKPCPHCGVRIEKNGGCDYIQCTQCGYEFCWECAHPHNHATHVCTFTK